MSFLNAVSKGLKRRQENRVRARRINNFPIVQALRMKVEEPERAKTYKGFAITALVVAVLAAGIAWPAMWAGVALVKIAFTYLGVFTIMIGIGNILILCASIICFILPFAAAIYGIFLPFASLICNRHWLSWVSLPIALAGVGATFYLAITSITTHLG
ncbi:MAG: hypothetical protein LBM01_02785 [Christensenellaceae bacterium]|nr:hypothetical protein [Christensenellaceae bacterium]